MSDNFYYNFEAEFRGSRDDIKNRLRVYVPLLDGMLSINSNLYAIDLGCGRCEWLETLEDKKIKAKGIDIDERMVFEGVKRGFDVEKKEAIEFLKTLSSNSVNIVTGFHIAEHMHFDDLRNLLLEIFRVLAPGGLLILETPNPENISVSSYNFFTDPTHVRPLPPELLKYLAKISGFDMTQILRLNSLTSLPAITRELAEIHHWYEGAFLDYSVLAVKPGLEADINPLSHISNFPERAIDTLGRLLSNYDKRINSIESSIQKLDQLGKTIESSFMYKLIMFLRKFTTS